MVTDNERSICAGIRFLGGVRVALPEQDLNQKLSRMSASKNRLVVEQLSTRCRGRGGRRCVWRLVQNKPKRAGIVRRAILATNGATNDVPVNPPIVVNPPAPKPMDMNAIMAALNAAGLQVVAQ